MKICLENRIKRNIIKVGKYGPSLLSDVTNNVKLIVGHSKRVNS
jgi:hypothetical protein